MEEGDAAYADLDEIIGEDTHKTPVIRACAVKLELREREKDHRDLTQDEIASAFMVDSRTLRIWVTHYRKDGADGIKRHKGQGRKPDLSDEQVRAAINSAQESGGFQSTPENEADNCGACKEMADARAEGRKAPPRRAAPTPAACKCDGSCEQPRKCKCEPGKACKCKCCRNVKLPPRGPRHASGCPLARILPQGVVTAALLHGTILAMFGKNYSMGHVYALLHKHGLASKKLAGLHVNHACISTVRSWQHRLRGRLKRLRDAGYAIASFDECYMVRDRAAGRVWVERGMKAVQIYTGTRERVALFGYYFEDCTHRFQEYAFGDTYSVIESLKIIAAEYGRVAIIMDRMSAHNSKAMKKFLRGYRAAHPDRDIQLIFLPRGSPYLNVVEECWNLLKKAVAQHYYYPRLDDFRWAITDYLRTARFSMDMEEFLYRNPRLHVESAAR